MLVLLARALLHEIGRQSLVNFPISLPAAVGCAAVQILVAVDDKVDSGQGIIFEAQTMLTIANIIEHRCWNGSIARVSREVFFSSFVLSAE